MATPSTPNGIFSNPDVASPVDEDLWGGILNSNFDIADSRYTTAEDDLDFDDHELSKPILNDFGESRGSVSSTAGAVTFDFSVYQHHQIILDENVTAITLSNPSPAATVAGYIIFVKQDGTGGWTVAWPAPVIWAGGVAPVITSTAGRTDKVVLVWDADVAKYLASITQNYNV